MLKRSRLKYLFIALGVLLVATIVVVAIGEYGGETAGTAVDSPLPTPEHPTDTPEPPTDTPEPPTATPKGPYTINLTVKWYAADGNLMGGPPADLSPSFQITAHSGLGSATCAYPAGSTSLSCEYSTKESTQGGGGLQVPADGSYTVSQSGLPAGWSSMGGTGTFPVAGSTHVVSNRAPAVVPTETPTPKPPASSSTEATDTPKPPAPTDTPVPPTDTPVPPTDTPVPPTDTPVPPTDTPKPPTETPEPPTATPSEEAPPPEPTDTPAAVSQSGGGPTATSTPESGSPAVDQTGASYIYLLPLAGVAALGLAGLAFLLLRKRNG